MSTLPLILVVDDQASSRFLLEQQLRTAGFEPLMAADAIEGLALLERHAVDLILSDLVMPDIDGMAFLELIRARYGDIPFVVITAHGSITSAVEALRRGAFTYLEKTCEPDELRITLQRALDYGQLRRENDQFKHHLQEQFSFQNIITANPRMKAVLELASRVTTSPRTTVAIYGESGCGKEVLSRAIHFAGGGLPSGLIAVNCAAIPETLMESELFGHVRGAFTGAERDRDGKFCLARGGTILLDEIGDMPLALQAKLLRVLEERTFEKVGSNVPITANCRVIVATNNNLAKLMNAGRFREDLFHRINIFPITIPPLRERREDIPLLAEHFLNQFRRHQGKKFPGISPKGMEMLLTYHWPGNVRELRNCLERASIVTDDELIRPEHLSISQAGMSAGASVLPAGAINYQLSLTPEEISLDTITHKVLDITLERCRGNKSRAAGLLKINRKMFYR